MERLKLEYDCLEPAPDGELVRYADAEAELSVLRARVEELQEAHREEVAELQATCRARRASRVRIQEEDEAVIHALVDERRALRARVEDLEPPVVPEGWKVAPTGIGCAMYCLGEGVVTSIAKPPALLRALAWAIEHNTRPPHEDDDKKKE